MQVKEGRVHPLGFKSGSESNFFSFENKILAVFFTVRVISHGPISLKIVVLVGDTLLKFQYFMNNSIIL